MTTPAEKTTELEKTPVANAPHGEPEIVALGEFNNPQPMLKRVDEVIDGRKTGAAHYELGVIQDDANPLEFSTLQSPDRAQGILFRGMPSPSMLPIFQDALELRSTNRRVHFMMGEPGSGKTYLANLVAKARDPRGPIFVSCGGRNLGDLLFETVLDYVGGKAIYDEIDLRLQSGNINPASIAILENTLGDAFSRDEETGAISIDWSQASQYKEPNAERSGDLSEEEQQKLGEETKAKAEQHYQNVLMRLNQVADLEGIARGSAEIAHKVVKGPLLRAIDEDREVIFDEYNKGKVGTDDALHGVWEVLRGDRDSVTVSDGGLSYEINKDNLGDIFFVTCTGNRPKDGKSTNLLSESATDRLNPVMIEDPTEQDIAHRFCQAMTEAPITTMRNAMPEAWKQMGDDAFTRFIVDRTNRGKTEAEIENTPSWKSEMLNNWDRVEGVSTHIAKFFYIADQLVNPNSDFYENTSTHSMKEDMDRAGVDPKILLNEIDGDENFQKVARFGQRAMLKMVEDATRQSAKARRAADAAAFDVDTPATARDGRSKKAPVEHEFGDRFIESVFKYVDNLTQDKPETNKALRQLAGVCGFFPVDLGEGASSAKHLISDALNLDPEKMNKLPENIPQIQDWMCDYIREIYADQFENLPENMTEEQRKEHNDQIMNPAQLARILMEKGSLKEFERDIARSGRLVVPNIDVGSLVQEPLTEVVSVDAPLVKSRELSEEEKEVGMSDEAIALHEKLYDEHQGLEAINTLSTDSLLDVNRLLLSLAIPDISAKNLKNLWNDFSLSYTQDPENLQFDSYALSHNNHPSGLATQLLVTKAPTGEVKDGQPVYRDEYLHVIHDSKGNYGKGRTLITGTQAIKPALAEALEATGITYVQRPEKQEVEVEGETVRKPDEAALTAAQEKVNTVLGEIFAAKTVDEKSPLEETLFHAIANRVICRIRPGKEDEEQLYELPHPEFHKGPQGMDGASFRAMHMENIVSVVLDEGDALAKIKDKKKPFYVTDQSSVEEVRHTLRAQQSASGPQAGASL